MPGDRVITGPSFTKMRYTLVQHSNGGGICSSHAITSERHSDAGGIYAGHVANVEHPAADPSFVGMTIPGDRLIAE
jgi:hypothetical protein